jgi:hypothetical protein
VEGVFCELRVDGVLRSSPRRVTRGMKYKKRAGTNTPALGLAF